MSTIQHLPGIVATTTEHGTPIRFFIKDVGDVIQNHHLNGRFYEIQELGLMNRHFPKGGVYLDIGSNVGNHIIYVFAAGLTTQIIAIEPNPEAIEILRVNLLLNGLLGVDTQHLGLGLSDLDERAHANTRFAGNLGDTRMETDPNGPIRLVAGDTLFADRQIDFIKMDVEGHEMKALHGLARTIEKNRPIMFIEVDNANREAFNAWVEANNYVAAETFKRYAVNENVLVRPKEKPLPA